MKIPQLSVFIENKTGRLHAVIDALAKNGINISALSLADTSEYGILRLIVDDPDKARDVLSKIGVIVKVSYVVAMGIEDKPGGLAEVLRLFSENGVGTEYMYACIGKATGKAFVVMRVDETDVAEKILDENGFGVINPSEIYRI